MSDQDKRPRSLVLSVTIRDCRVETCRGSGKGGQNRNKRDTAVRIVHEPSGAVGQAQEHRTQLANKRAAFLRMGESEKFQAWAKLEAAKRAGSEAMMEAEVERALRPKNLLIEGKDAQGRWSPSAMEAGCE